MRRIFDLDSIKEALDEIAAIDKIPPQIENPITAAGCLFYKTFKNAKYLLLINYKDPKWPLLDDLGGKTDMEDKTIFETVIRETMEETNNIIDPSNYFKSEEKYKTFYTPESKYLCVLIQEAPDFHMNPQIFGDTEHKDNILRNIKWYKYTPELKDKLSHRLRLCGDLHDYLKSV